MHPNHLIPHLSTEKDPKDFQARFSKWITLDLLIDEVEISNLIFSLSSIFLVSPQNATPETPFLLKKEIFLDAYASYISDLKSGKTPPFNGFKKFFYMMISANLDGLFIRSIGKDKEALAINAPLIEVKPISLVLSKVDQSIRTSAVSPEGILWGLSFSFPQIIQDPKTLHSSQIDLQNHPTGQCFKKIRSWLRSNTRATPFIIGSKKVNASVRLGKNCFEWINFHPELRKQNILVEL